MKTKYLIITAMFCVLSIIGCIAANAATTNKVPITDIEQTKTDTNVSKIPNTSLEDKMTWTLNDGTKVDLTYSHVETGIFIDRYKFIDNNNNNFSFDSEGDLVSFHADDSWMFEIDLYDYVINPLDESEWISEENAERIARMHGETFYGDVFDDYKLSQIEKEDGYKYTLSFVKKMGKDDCITASYAYVCVKHDGVIQLSAIHQHKVAASVDERKLAEIDMYLINAVAEANAMAIYTDNFRGLEVREVLLVQDGDNYALRISTHVDYYDDDLKMIGGSIESFYYNIK